MPENAIQGDWFSHSLVNNFDRPYYSEILWMINLNGMSYGSQSIYASKIKYATIDTFLDYIYLGKSDYEQFTSML